MERNPTTENEGLVSRKLISFVSEVSFDIFPEKLNKGTYVIERIEVNVLLYYVIGIKDLGE